MTLPAVAFALVFAVCPWTSASAHDGDPKLEYMSPAHRGRGYRAAWARADGVPLSATAADTAFPAQGVELLAWLPVGEFGTEHSLANDCWGYASPSGREYALLGLSDGTAFVDISVPSDPVIVAMEAGPETIWRDIKTYGQHAYVVSEGGPAIQVYDLSQIDAGVVTHVADVTQGGISSSHNLYIDEVSGFLYRCGGAENGLRIYSLSDPIAPSFVGSWSARYVHDVQVVTHTQGPLAGKQIAYAFGGFNQGFDQSGVDILDVTDKGAIVELSRVQYPGASYAHQGWLGSDGKYLFVNDELDEINFGISNTWHLLDVSTPSQASYVQPVALANESVGHNLYVIGDEAFAASYTAGLRIYDVSDPLQPVETAYFDTMPYSDTPDLNSLWGVYPFLPSGVLIGSDREKGLFVWWRGDPELEFSYPAGTPAVIDPAGGSILVEIGEAAPGVLAASSPKFHYDDGSGLASAPLVPLGDGSWRADVPPTPCGSRVSWYVSAESTGGIVWSDPGGHVGLAHEFLSAQGAVEYMLFDMESAAGWPTGAPDDDATEGLWAHGAPVESAGQPGEDHSPGPGQFCWFTGQNVPGDPIWMGDVDGGKTTVSSPPFNIGGLDEPYLEFWHWFQNAGGLHSLEDVLALDLSNDGGETWVRALTIGPHGPETTGGWWRSTIRVRDWIEPTAQVHMRLVATDLGENSTVEAAFDDVRLYEPVCPDCDGNGAADAQEILDGSGQDLDGDGLLDICQPFYALVDQISLAGGGTQVLHAQGGSENAGLLSLMLGSETGTEPGLPVGNLVLPLVWDIYTDFALTNPNIPPLTASTAVLDDQGDATFEFEVPAGSNPALAGKELWHAWVGISPSSGQAVFTSNAVRLELIP